jgi:Protein of unknown function (DUF2889)
MTAVPSHFPYGNYRRRIRLVATEHGIVEAGLEDDAHYFKVLLRHDGRQVQAIEANAPRPPWSTCADAAQPLQALVGMPLSLSCLGGGAWTNALHNCTHMFDLAGLAVAHAARVVAGTGAPRRQYDAEVPHGGLTGGTREVRLRRDGELVLTWTVDGKRCLAPPPFSEVSFTGGFLQWADRTFAPDDAEAAIVLRRACTIGLLRGVDLDQHDNLAEITTLAASPTCYATQPERVAISFRNRGTIRDYDHDPDAMLAEGPA